jgi:hypothetical protein
MVTHRRAILALLALSIALVAGCDKVPLLAPTGSVISLFPQTTSVSLNSRINIIATVIENGTAAGGSGTTTTRTGNGTPVQNGTVVTFTTTLGRIEPSEARTHNGEVTVELVTDSSSGTATVTAFSGGASTSTTLKVGTAAVKTVIVTTVPQSLGANGGSVQVIGSVTDDGGNPIAGVPVTFATDKGSISPSTVTSDAGGNAAATLTTSATAKVTATAGTVTSTGATVTVGLRGLSGFSASPQATSAGTPVTFTVTPTTGANITDVRVNFGDGSSSQSLGAISVATPVSHVYNASGTYTATASATDASGDAGSLSTTVIVGSLQVTLSASSSNPLVGTPVTFTAGGLGTAVVDHFTWTLDDGTGPFTTAGPQLTHTFGSRGAKTVRVDVFGINGGKLGSATTSVDVQ